MHQENYMDSRADKIAMYNVQYTYNLRPKGHFDISVSSTNFDDMQGRSQEFVSEGDKTGWGFGGRKTLSGIQG